MPKKFDRIAFFDGLAVFTDSAFADNSATADRVPPREFMLVKYGKNNYTKDGQRGEFDFKPEDASAVLADFAVRSKEGVIDYEHQTLSGNKAPAAGWISKLEKTADGLKAVLNYWTDEAAGYLKTGAYKYFSPVFHFSRTGSSVTSLHSVALTNHPALHGIPALVADDLAGNEELDEHMINNKTKGFKMEKLLAILGLAVAFADKADEDKTKAIFGEVEKLLKGKTDVEEFLKLHDSDSLDKITGKIQGMVPAADKLKLEDALKERDAVSAVTVAMTDGKVTEAAKPWAIDFAKREPKAFSDWCIGAPRVVPDNKGTEQRQAAATEIKTFSDTEKKVLRNMGLTDEDINKLEKDK